jgi:hypothetical protein
MTGNKKHLSILTLNKMASMPQSRDIEQQTRLKNRTQPYLGYKRLISLNKINTGLESKGGKKFSKQIDPITVRS